MVYKNNSLLSICTIILCGIETISLIHIYIILLMNPDDIEVPIVIFLVICGLGLLISTACAIRAYRTYDKIKYRQRMLISLAVQILVVLSSLFIDVFRYEINELMFAIHAIMLPFLLSALLNNMYLLNKTVKDRIKFKKQYCKGTDSYWE